MPINITNIINVVNTRVAALDSSSDIRHVRALDVANDYLTNVGGVLKYQAESELPEADSSNIGSFALVERTINLDSANRSIFVNAQGDWSRIFTIADSADSDLSRVSGSSVVYGFQGETSGYATAGILGSTQYNRIDKHPFAVDEDATEVSSLSIIRYNQAGSSSAEHGYTTGGRNPTNTGQNQIDRFDFATDANASDVGNLGVSVQTHAGQSNIEGGYGYATHGYTSGGNANTTTNMIQKFAFTSSGNSTAAGDVTAGSYYTAGQSSLTDGYATLGYSTPPLNFRDTIEKFPFATDVDGVSHGTMPSAPHYTTAGMSSYTNGYQVGGTNADRYAIDTFPFASGTGAARNTGVLSPQIDPSAGIQAAGNSSTVSGYYIIGEIDNTGYGIMKFPFASDVDATAVGDLSNSRRGISGNQV